MDVRFRRETWPLRIPFRITGYTYLEAHVGVVELEHEGIVGRGEASGAQYKGDDIEAIEAGVEAVQAEIRAGADRRDLQSLLPDCGARNALDCAFWELEARRAGLPAWRLAGAESPRPLITTYTIGADDPAAMADRARIFTDARALKIKLLGEDLDLERVRAVRAARPEVWLGVDANRGYTPDRLEALMPTLVDASVRLIEQPFAIGCEADMEGLSSPIPTAADESAQTLDDLDKLEGRFDIVNLKLDKCGGLTQALEMAEATKKRGLGLMVGNMTGTSWAQAPAFILGQQCEIVDLDGPLLLAADRTPGAEYRDGRVFCSQAVWGGPQ